MKGPVERIKVNTNFYLDEFVDPFTYFNNEDHGMSLVDDRLFDAVQLLRYLYLGPISINNWWSYFLSKKDIWSIDKIILSIEGNSNLNKWSGLRTYRTNIGSIKSAHRSEVNGKCLAIDPKGNEQVLFAIVKNNAKAFHNLGVRRLEDPNITQGWLHMDLLDLNTKPKSIRVINLTTSTETIYFK